MRPADAIIRADDKNVLMADGFMSHIGGLSATEATSMTASVVFSSRSSTFSITIPYVTSMISWPDRSLRCSENPSGSRTTCWRKRPIDARWES